MSPRLGQRYENMVWTGNTWTLLCPVDDVAMTERNSKGELTCPRCWKPYRELVR